MKVKVFLRVNPKRVEISDTWYGGDVPADATLDDVFELLAEDPIAVLEEITGVGFNDHAWPKILAGLFDVEIEREVSAEDVRGILG